MSAPSSRPPGRAFRWLWLGQLISNLGTQCSLYGIGLWSFERQGLLLDFAAVAIVVQLAKILVLPLLGRRLSHWAPRRVMLLANGAGALCTLLLALQLLVWGRPHPWVLLLLLALAAMAEATLVLRFASLIPALVPDPARRARANGLFASGDGLVLSVAPFLGSWLLAAGGLAGVLLLDGLTFALAMGFVLLAWTPGLARLLQEQQAQALPEVPAPALRLRALLRSVASRAVLLTGSGMALVYAATEVMFPAWLIAGPSRDRLGMALMLGGAGYVIGFQLWSRWGWRWPAAVLRLALLLQSLILMGAGLVVFEIRPGFWSGGVLVFCLLMPMALSALQTRWQQLVPPAALPRLLAQRYRLEWLARLLAFSGSALLVDAILRPALAWPHWPTWLIDSLGRGAERPLAVGLGAMGWVLVFTLLAPPLLSRWFSPPPSGA
ncbi:MAG: MFS transporter [Cyanobium sp.]